MTQVTTTEEAMNAVLTAERQAREAIDACRDEAARLLDEARRTARHIGERTDLRITRLHTRCEADANRRVEAMLRAERVFGNPIPASSEDEILQAAVNLLADELISPGEAP